MECKIIKMPKFNFVGVSKRVPMQFEGVNNEIVKLAQGITQNQMKELHRLQNIAPCEIVNVSNNSDAHFMKEEGYLTHMIGVLTTEEHEAFGRGKLLISLQFDKSVCNNQISLLLQNVSVWLLMRSGAFFARSHQPNKAVVNFNVLVSLTVYDGSFSNFNAVNQFLNDFPVQFLQVQILPDGSGPLVDIGDVLLGFPFPG